MYSVIRSNPLRQQDCCDHLDSVQLAMYTVRFYPAAYLPTGSFLSIIRFLLPLDRTTADVTSVLPPRDLKSQSTIGARGTLVLVVSCDR